MSVKTLYKAREEASHFLFELGIIIKAIIGVGEIIAGMVYALFTHAEIFVIIERFFKGVLETPFSFLWTIISVGYNDLASTPELVWVLVFLSHGIIKVFVIGALWKKKLWAYPAIAGVFTIFALYQLYELFFTPSVMLWVITIFDIALVILTLHEYHHKKTRK